MKIENSLSDTTILEEIGHRLASRRLTRQLTQAELAEQAGVSKRTIERVEAGESTQLSTIIRVMRVLDALSALDKTLTEAGPRPIDLLKLKGKERQRARSKKRRPKNTPQWTWGDET